MLLLRSLYGEPVPRQDHAEGVVRHSLKLNSLSVGVVVDALRAVMTAIAECLPGDCLVVLLRPTLRDFESLVRDTGEQLISTSLRLVERWGLQRQSNPPLSVPEVHGEMGVVRPVVVVDVVPVVSTIRSAKRESSEGHVAFSRMGTHQKPIRGRIAASFFHEVSLVHIPASDPAGSTVALQGSVATRHRGGPTRLGGRAVPDAPTVLAGKEPLVKRYGAELRSNAQRQLRCRKLFAIENKSVLRLVRDYGLHAISVINSFGFPPSICQSIRAKRRFGHHPISLAEGSSRSQFVGAGDASRLVAGRH